MARKPTTRLLFLVLLGVAVIGGVGLLGAFESGDQRHVSPEVIAPDGSRAGPSRATPSAEATKSRRAIEDYWTPRRMREARPVTPGKPPTGDAVDAEPAGGDPGFAGPAESETGY